MDATTTAHTQPDRAGGSTPDHPDLLTAPPAEGDLATAAARAAVLRWDGESGCGHCDVRGGGLSSLRRVVRP